MQMGRTEELDEVIDFVKKYFVSFAPVRQLVGYDDDIEETKEQSWLVEPVKHTLSKPHSLLVRDSADGRLVAVRLNMMKERNEALTVLEPRSRGEGGLAIEFLKSVNEGIDVFSLYNVDRVLYLFLLAVRSDLGRLGLAAKLYELSIEIAKENGAGALKFEAGSEFAARASMKVGFVPLKSVNFADLELDGERPLANDDCGLGVHRVGRLMGRPVNL